MEDNSNNNMRLDLIFSWWLFMWFILYFLKIIPYSPKFALIIGVIVNIFIIMYFIYKDVSLIKIIYFISINFIIKILPLLYLQNDNIHKNDIYTSVMLLIIYYIWLHINKQNITENINNVLNLYIDKTKMSPSLKKILLMSNILC